MKQKFLSRQTQRLCAFLIIFALTFFWQSCKKQATQLPQDTNVVNNIDNPKQTRGYNKMLNLGTFIYYSQLTAGPSNTYRFNGCIAASCLMGAHLYASPIAVNTNTFSTYCAGMGVVAGGASIGPLPPNYNNPSAYKYLRNIVFQNTQPQNVTRPKTDAGKTSTINDIKSFLNMNRSIVARIQYNVSTKLPTTSTGVGTVGHFVLIVGLSEPGSVGTGTVYVYDPYDNPNLKNWNWATFLTAMQTGSNSMNYMRIGS